MVSNPLRRFALAVVAAVLGFSAQAGQIQLAWDPVPGATGYRVYYGTQSGVYTANVTTSAMSASKYFEVRRYGITATSATGNTRIQIGAYKVFNKF